MDHRFLILALILVLLVAIFAISLPMWQMHMQMMGFYFPMYGFLILATIFSLLIVFFAFYIMKPSETVSKKAHYVYPLTNEEMAVVNFLKNKDYRSTQKEIQIHFNFSKVKAHRILRSLESKGVIIRTKRGREMLVVLKREEVS
ncbi:MAG TPA: hypothetical protein VKU94_04525 [Geobacterales bacterium]|nr:hypothetical protein [Geobacterales bacterium]